MAFVGHRSVSRPDGSTADSWQSFHCAHCDTDVNGAVIAAVTTQGQGVRQNVWWLECNNCGLGSVCNGPTVSPGARFGPHLQGLPKPIEAAYEQARRSMSVDAFTGVELICRKILMHVAVEKGAAAGDSFASYLTHLEKQGYVTPPMKGWVDVIRQHGNKATHELDEPDRQRAESTLMFTAELLRLTYEMEHLAKRYAPPPP